jgi:hypothetical protein
MGAAGIMRSLFAAFLFCFLGSFASSQTNIAPTIFADVLPDYLGHGAFLTCSVSDDGLVRPVTFTWSRVSGPGTVTWTARYSQMTHARFSVKGLYVVSCAVSDGQFIVTDKVTLAVDDFADVAVRP